MTLGQLALTLFVYAPGAWLASLAFFRGCVVILALLGLVACASGPRPQVPPVQTVTVDRPVARSCVPPKLGPAPRYVDSDAALRAAAGPEDRYQLVIAGRVQRNARLGEVEPVIDGCR